MGKSIKEMSGDQPSNLVADGTIIASTVQPFGEVVLELPENDAVYAAKARDAGPSTQAAKYSFAVHVIGGASLTVVNRVYARLQPDGDLTLEVGTPYLKQGTGIKLDTATKNAMLAHVNAAIADWPLAERAFDAAHKALTEPIKPAVKGKASAAPIRYTPTGRRPAAA